MANPTKSEAKQAFSEFTLRAILTGMVLGAVLSLTNIYSGLKIGWGFNMSITAGLLSFAFWQGLHKAFGTRKWDLLENNINQTSASSAAAISSAGLVAPIPALTIMTGQTLAWHWMSLWVFSVTLVGISVAIGLRRQMILIDKLPFPSGIATAETLREMYAHGKAAMARVKVLAATAVTASVLKISEMTFSLQPLALPGVFRAKAGGALAAGGISSYTLKNLSFALEPSLLMIGVGALIGIRACVSLLLGAVLAWGVIGPMVLELDWVDAVPNDPTRSWYGPMLKWLLWPGVAMMVTASLTSFAFSWRSIVAAITGKRGDKKKAEGERSRADDDVPAKWFLATLLIALILSVTLQATLFSIAIWTATLGVLLTFLLAVVAGRVSGETAVTPVGAMGKVTQLLFGVIAPGQPAANLMSANVTGGAASQCADLLHDLKCGSLLGASPRLQTMAQVFGSISGALAGSAAYLILVPDPARQLMTDEWPAPAVAAWKAVADIFKEGLSAMPPGSISAIVWAGAIGIALAIAEKVVSKNYRNFVPSPASLGLAFVIPAYNSISMFLGGAIGLVASRYFKSWTAKFLTVAASGLIAGESLTGVAMAIKKMILN